MLTLNKGDVCVFITDNVTGKGTPEAMTSSERSDPSSTLSRIRRNALTFFTSSIARES